ncbi:MAG TPA: helix-hairpin-helix domain-containing protein [Candidatus Thermoplasmatota archaeon]|nr:helix-hairpin-helix domain-containing protein [Candidatus Thermoplasmatota archaeon]
MPVTNEQVARILYERADALTLEGANQFRVRAYRKAARSIEGLGKSVATLVAIGHDLTQIPGVGEGLAEAVKAIVKDGVIPVSKAKPTKPVPKGATELMGFPGLGPKRARQLAEAGISSRAELEAAATEGRLRTMKGFGATLEASILEGLRNQPKQAERRRIRPLLVTVAERLRGVIAGAPGIERVEPAGSYRRLRDTVADFDFVAVGDEAAAQAAMDALADHLEVSQVLNRGPTKMSVRLTKGMQVDLRVVPLESFGAAMVYFTGSKEHNVALRALAMKRKWKLNEYGLFAGEKRVAGATEEDVYKALGLPVVPPELREDRGEVQAASQGKLPRLVSLSDLQGDLHTHTDATDGHSSLESMAKAAIRRGLRYMAVTDHTPRTSIAGGMPWPRFQAQSKLVDKLNKGFEDKGVDFRILKGAEVDILKDGKLDLPASALEQLEVVVASLHFREKHTPQQLTDRVLKAMGTGHADILGHPSGRLLGKRDPMEHDWTRLIEAAKDQGWAFECDGSPWRQDLWDTLVHHCKKAGVRISCDSDAHSTGELAYTQWAVEQARRGWMEKDDVLNTRSADELLKLLS